MKYKIIEREIYSESMLLHFGEKFNFGDIVNHHFPDYSGVPLGESIFSTNSKEEAIDFKNKLEVKRLKTLEDGILAFFDDNEKAEKFYTSEKFSTLANLYKNEYGLKLVRSSHNEMIIDKLDFRYPPTVTDEHMLLIQTLIDVSFFKVIKVN